MFVFVHYVFSVTLKLENDQAVMRADSGGGHIQLAVGETIIPQIHTTYFETLPLVFIDSHREADLHRELQSFDSKKW